jgi:O-acetyl-ADP-ribose deacetylase (regulator of RNase III)
MGAGIALQVKRIYPEAYAVDCKTRVADQSKLGTFSAVSTPRCRLDGTYVNSSNSPIIIVNGYTQFDYGTQSRRADYKAIHSVFKNVKQRFSGKSIAYPRIGAGLARGNWDLISRIIDEELAGEDHTVVLLPETK